MPTYDYKCSDCGHVFEHVQSMKDPLLVTCPSCGKETLVRLISGGGVIFKGSGFYQTDYKGGAPKSDAAPVAADAPAAKPESKPSTESTTTGSTKKEE